MTKPYLENGILWMSAAQFARNYHKSRWTALRWIMEGFVLQLGYCIWRDPAGRWFVGKRIPEVSSHK